MIFRNISIYFFLEVIWLFHIVWSKKHQKNHLNITFNFRLRVGRTAFNWITVLKILAFLLQPVYSANPNKIYINEVLLTTPYRKVCC